jgi:hypothetical protein
MRSIKTALVGAIFSLWTATGAAQELTPRAYWPLPKGARVAVAGYSFASGGVFFDPSIPFYGVDSTIHAGVFAYLQSFSLWGRTATIQVDLPYSWGESDGLIYSIPARASFSGIGDLGATLSVNLLGAPSMSPKEFQELRADPHPILGMSFKIVAPTGSYDSERLLNVGANRWAGRAELGCIIPLRPKWLLEVDGGAWFFGDDEDFLVGKKEQASIFAARFHLVRRFKPGFWASLDLNYFTGGRQTIEGNRLDDLQRNSRLGGTVVVPIQGRHAIKLGYSRGVVTEYGTHFHQFLVSYQVLLN